jgi:hypothetical protein
VAPASPAPTRLSLAGLAPDVPLHLATIFGSDHGGLRISGAFLAEGQRLRQPCFLVAAGADLRRYERALGSLEGIEVVHFEGGTAAAAIAHWEDRFADVVANGATLIRVVGEMASERTMFGDEEEMLRYEEAFEVMCRRYPVAVLCQYDARQFDGVALLRALKAHPDLFGLRLGSFLL